MDIVKLPDTRLRKKCVNVDINNMKQEVIDAIEFMIEWIDDSQKEESDKRAGVGIAAPQVGRPWNIFYINNDENSTRDVFINPKVIATSNQLVAIKAGEGCLSVNDDVENGYVYRKYKIIIEAYSYFEKKIIVKSFIGYDAIVVQHELDHLNGTLFIDRINKNNRWEEKDNAIFV
ncbi:MAG: peptide deformylase [Mycoplasma sp.]|nr:peptide deformylase [Mycoplasma sp.]